MTIQEIVRQALLQIKKEGLVLTPDNYERIFCRQAKRQNVIVEDCQKLEKFFKRLSPELQKTVKERRISTVDQLVQYLASEVMRHDSGATNALIQSYVLLIKRLLQAVALFREAEAVKMAQKDKEEIAPYLNAKEIDAIREHWTEYVINFDDSFIEKLALHCGVDQKDLRTILQTADSCLREGKTIEQREFETAAKLLVSALVPSIASGMDDELAALSAQLRENPELLTSEAMVEDIRRAVKKRIELDKEAVVRQIGELDSIINHINETLMHVIDCGEANHDAICRIQIDLDAVDLKADSFEVIHAKLLAIAKSLEKETRVLNEEMYHSQEEVARLEKKVRLLEEALRQERKRSNTDSLTKLPNRRAIEDFLSKQEAQFQRYGDNYSVVLFDIDHFKTVNDTYGHDAGDVVLYSLGKMLRRYSRQIDFIGRLGGEEFLVVLPKTDRDGALRFAEKLRQVVEQSKFMYKNTRIPVTVSGGVADRLTTKSKEETVKKADENLYKAKEGGRNRVVG